MAAELRIGTSGYSFRDWAGTVYPRNAKPGDYLSHYARWFDVVEINTTYYRIPEPEMFERMLSKVSSRFGFVVKTPKEMTHERAGTQASISPFIRALQPLLEQGQLESLLAQFPYAFRPDPASWEHVERLADALREVAPLYVEFRHVDWDREETYDRLTQLGVGLVNVDLPPLRGLPGPTARMTNGSAYVRLHGRNTRMWWNHPTSGHRYDYLYRAEELGPWIERIDTLRSKADKLFVFANNCHLGQSVVNALQLADRFELPKPPMPPGQMAALLEPSRAEVIETLRSNISVARRHDPSDEG